MGEYREAILGSIEKGEYIDVRTLHSRVKRLSREEISSEKEISSFFEGLRSLMRSGEIIRYHKSEPKGLFGDSKERINGSPGSIFTRT